MEKPRDRKVAGLFSKLIATDDHFAMGSREKHQESAATSASSRQLRHVKRIRCGAGRVDGRFRSLHAV
jgi:hypothetical protein